MKPNLIILTLIALFATSCGTSIQLSGRYVDDLYYWPGDTPPEAVAEEQPVIGLTDKKSNNDMLIISEVGEDENGNKTLDNYIYADKEPEWYSDVQAQNIQNIDSISQDTITLPSGDEETYVINNNYLDDNEYYSYSDRIRSFQDPYYYDPYWGSSIYMGFGYPYYRGYLGWNSWGWNSWYYDPFYYSWGYSPFYNDYYWGGGYYGWYSPYNYYHYGNNHLYDNDRPGRDEDYASNRRSRNPNAIYSSGGVGTTSSGRGESVGNELASSNKSGSTLNRRTVENDGTSTQKSVSTTTSQERSTSAVLSEKRRNSANVGSNPSVNTRSYATSGSGANSSTTSGQNYDRRTNTTTTSSTNSTLNRSNSTPSYNKPRTNTRASYNTNRTSTSEQTKYSTTSSDANTRTRSSGATTKSTYQIPSSSSTTRSYGSSSLGTVKRSSSSSGSSSTPTRSYSTGSSSSSSRSYSSGSSTSSRSYSSGSSSSTPSRSYSSGSSGASHSSGSSSGGSSGGGHRR